MSTTASNVTGHVALVERKRGDKWYLRYRLADGRKVQKCLGPDWVRGGRPPAGHFTQRLAEETLDAVLTDARRGTLAGSTTGASFADAAAEYLRYVEFVKQIDAATVADYRGVIDGYLLDEFEGPVEAVTPDLIDVYKERLISEGKLSNRTIVRHLTVLHGIFKRAKRVWKLKENPATADMVERPKVVYSGEFDTLDGDEIDLLAAAAVDAQDAALYRTAAFTGLRQGELLALRWENVDFVGGLLHVRRNFTDGREKVPKGKRVRSVPMMPEVIDVLAKLKERDYFTADSDLVFCSETGGHLDHFKLRKRFYAALEKAKLRRIRFHDLRHCFGSAAIQKLDPFKVQSYMGHQHYSTTQRYLHHKPQREDAAALAEAFGRPESQKEDAYTA
ncbi:MAG TPA: site-specific integrase [Solirubrobacterales bacterium]|jgi:integrase|nr:site-specific integrase [Solirubrobacterales bacterium]